MIFKETNLPTIGKKFSAKLKEGREIVLVIHETGKRELYLLKNDEVETVFTLDEDEAKELGILLIGALYQPVKLEKMELIMKGIIMEWIKVPKNSKVINKTIKELEIRKKTGVSIIAIERNNNIIPNPEPDEFIKENDTLIIIGSRNQIQKFMEFLNE